MLVGNYSILNKNPCRWFGGNSTAHASGRGQSVTVNRSNWSTSGAARNMSVQDGASNLYWSLPNGYNAWIFPITAGYLASHNLIAGDGDAAASIAGGRNAVCAITGEGTFAGTGQLIVSASAALSGVGTFAGLGVGTLAASATLSGDGDLTALLGAIASVTSTLDGMGDIAATIRATGELAAEINVTGDLLTTATVGSAVWSESLEAGFSADRILRIIAAAVAGESTGGPDTPAFRNVSDTENMISGDADADGNRSNITYGD